MKKTTATYSTVQEESKQEFGNGTHPGTVLQYNTMVLPWYYHKNNNWKYEQAALLLFKIIIIIILVYERRDTWGTYTTISNSMMYGKSLNYPSATSNITQPRRKAEGRGKLHCSSS